MEINNNKKNIIISIDLDKNNLDKINQVVINIENGKLSVSVINNEESSTIQLKDDEINQQIDSKLIAVLATAAYAVLGKPVRVKKVAFLNSRQDSAWTRMGVLSEISQHNKLR